MQPSRQAQRVDERPGGGSLEEKLREFDIQDENVFAIAILKQGLGG